MNPEESARIKIDKLLTQCGWTVQDYTSLDLSASRGVALREVPLKKGRCDYLLLVDRKAVGIVEAKPGRNHAFWRRRSIGVLWR